MKDRSAFWVLAAVFSTSLGVGLIFGFEPPLMAMVLNRAANSTVTIGGVIAISLVSIVAVGPVYPRLIARIGLQRSVVVGVAFSIVVLLVMPFWTGVPAWLVLRVLTGCAVGLSWIASEIWMNRVAGDGARGTVMGIYGTVFSIGTVAGPLLLEFTGTVGAWPFFAGALCLALTLLPLALLRQVAESSARHAAGHDQPLHDLARLIPVAPAVMAAALIAGLVESADLSLLPLFGLRDGLSERSSLLLLTVFLAGNVVLQLPIGLLADRFGRRLMLGVCALTSGVGPLLLQACIHEPLLLWPLLFVWGGTMYAFYSQGVALLGEIFPAGDLAGANTLFVMIYCFGGVLGPSVGGLLMDLWPQNGLPVLLSVSAFGLLAGLVFGRRWRAPNGT
ncbi:MAG: MFS transporter [Steroidobacterales bacterium]